MTQRRIPAAFMRGSTSNAHVYYQKDLPTDRKLSDAIFLAAIGSPAPRLLWSATRRHGRRFHGGIESVCHRPADA